MPPRAEPMQLTARDVEIVHWVYQARIATREQIQKLFFSAGSRSLCQRRLTLLFRNRYVDKLVAQALSAPDVYYISRRCTKGLRLLRALLPEEVVASPRVNPRTMAHSLDVASCRIAFLQGCAALHRPMITWLDERDLDQKMSHLGLRPDAYFQIARETPHGPKTSSFTLEVERSQKADVSHLRRYQLYGQLYYRSDPDIPSEYERLFQTRSLRVLVLVAAQYGIDPQRQITKLMDLCVKLDVTIVRFASLPVVLELQEAQVLTAPIWRQPGNSEPCALLAQSAL